MVHPDPLVARASLERLVLQEPRVGPVQLEGLERQDSLDSLVSRASEVLEDHRACGEVLPVSSIHFLYITTGHYYTSFDRKMFSIGNIVYPHP